MCTPKSIFRKKNGKLLKIWKGMNEIMLCKNCGNLNEPESKFCTFCGADLSSTNTEESPDTPTPAPTYYTSNVVPQNTNQNSEDGKGLAIASLVLGIVSFFCFAYITGILGIVLGAVAKSKGYKGAMATAGIICGALGIVLWIIMLVGRFMLLPTNFSSF